MTLVGIVQSDKPPHVISLEAKSVEAGNFLRKVNKPASVASPLFKPCNSRLYELVLHA